MCVILLAESVRPTRHLLETAEKRNKDGIGMAWIEQIPTADGTEPTVRFEKGITMDRAVALCETVPFPFIVHLRVKTAGSVSAEMCHPFPITEEVGLYTDGHEDAVLFHNGTFIGWDDHLLRMALSSPDFNMPNGEWSDTRAMAKMVHYTRSSGFVNLCKDTKQPNRVCILDKYGTVTRYGRWFHYDRQTIEGKVADGQDPKEMRRGLTFSNDYWNSPGSTAHLNR